ncbi:MAG: hypothetical protein A2277_13615 [Desulfobacterales bacterium RIFOXYA12_FULL_46_15]|nr:MAG: hypothetical protein A2277_13615 [Desulfobacterales bacterium RIFOXYA12_FULL_46_15]
MTKKKKAVWIAVILVLAMTVTGFGFAINSGAACGFGSFHRYGFSRRGMPPFMHEEIKNFIAWRMDNGAKGLGLSDTQKEQYDLFHIQFLETMEKALAARTEFKKKVMSTFENENPDLSVMATEAKTHVKALSDAIMENLTRFTGFYNSLDAAQRKIITDKIKAGIDDHINNFPCDGKGI